MNYYRQSICVFGLVLPVILSTAVVTASAFLKGKVEASYVDKSSRFSSFQTERQMCIGLEAQIGRKRPHLERWSALLKEETSSNVTSLLKQASQGMNSKEYQLTSVSRPNSTIGFGGATQQRHSPVQLSFRSTFRSMQHVFLSLESRMPQLQLDELRIERNSQSNTLNFQVGYTAWEN